MSKKIKLSKGLDIKLVGETEKIVENSSGSETYMLNPDDFFGLTPKILVKAGDEVKAGTPLFFDRNNDKVFFSSPVSGEVAEVIRGEKRKLLGVKILADKEISYVDFGSLKPQSANREAIIEKMLIAGVWPLLRQRPFSVIANPQEKPKAIHVSCFNSAPLAPEVDFEIHGQKDDFTAGIEALKKLTEGKVHLNVRNDIPVVEEIKSQTGVQINYFSGPHPAGNVGVQIHHIDPINKGEVVWYLYPKDVLIIGRLFNKGIYDASKLVALSGSKAKKRRYFKSIIGASVKSIVSGNIEEGNNRIISGNVLTGKKAKADAYVGYYDNQITVVPEGDHHEFLGWIAPGLDKFSMSRSFFSWLMPNKKYDLDTNLHGEERAFVVTGQYEKVFPMDIYPVQLLKSILVEDIGLMENLGIYEVDAEDFALCEFVCTSKINSQEIVKRGIETMLKEMA
jgi:Na+-transporting NADH:ubiquinone oxidoreductase subunit A